jgi:hypothetical protein
MASEVFAVEKRNFICFEFCSNLFSKINFESDKDVSEDIGGNQDAGVDRSTEAKIGTVQSLSD